MRPSARMISLQPDKTPLSRELYRRRSPALRLLSFISLQVFISWGCGEDEPPLNAATGLTGAPTSLERRSLKADQWETESAGLEASSPSVVRVTLAELTGEPTSLGDLSEHFEALPVGLNLSGDGSLREGVKGTLSAQRLISRGESGVLREDRFAAKGDITPRIWVDQGVVKSLLPSKMEAGAELTFARLYESEEHALAAPLLSPKDLPVDVGRALRLPEGTVVQLPLVARVSFQLTGKQLTGSWARVDELGRWLKSTAIGFTSAAPQATAIFEGRQVLTITRHEGSIVRVCLQADQDRRISGGAQVSAGLSERLTLYPAALVDRVKSVRERLLKWSKRPSEHLSAWAERLGDLKRGLPAVLKPLLEQARTGEYPPVVAHLIERASEALDPALTLLSRGQGDAEKASAWIEEQVEATLGAVDRRLNPLFDRVKRHSERALHLNATLSLNAEHRARVGVLGEYLIDLSAEEGALAYQLMISGVARWDGLKDQGGAQGHKMGTLDLTVADALASSEVKGVRRLRGAQLTSESRRITLSATGPLTSWRHQSDEQRYQLTRVEETREERWEAELWRVDRGWRGASLTNSEILQSGQLMRLDVDSEMSEPWIYWFSWRRQWPQSASTPVAEAFSEALNLTGSVGVSRGLPQLFYAEAEGALDAQLTVTYSARFLDALVDHAAPDLLWSAAATTAARFDNRFGLPFLSSLGTPNLSPEASLACDTVAFHWGSGYCWMIQDDLISPLLAIRASGLSRTERRAEQRRWLAELSQRGALLNPIGGRVIARWLAEVAQLLGMEGQVDIQLALHHPTAPEVSLSADLRSPTLISDPSAQAALEVAVWLGIGEGISYSP